MGNLVIGFYCLKLLIGSTISVIAQRLPPHHRPLKMRKPSDDALHAHAAR
jgi:hypothetical protein